MTAISKRRICWPEPDKVCLQGGCMYCNMGRFRSLGTISKYARDHGLQDDYLYGLEHDFFNAETR